MSSVQEEPASVQPAVIMSCQMMNSQRVFHVQSAKLGKAGKGDARTKKTLGALNAMPISTALVARARANRAAQMSYRIQKSLLAHRVRPVL